MILFPNLILFSQTAAKTDSLKTGTNTTAKLPEVVVQGTRESDPVTSQIEEVRQNYPGSVSTVTPQELSIQKASNLGEILARIPGAAYVDEDGRGTKPNIGLRGLNPIRSEYTQILLDGVPTQPSMYSEQAAYYGVPSERVAGIEIFKGGSSILFGPNTVGGVVNLISRGPSSRPFSTVLDARFDTYGDYLGNVFFSGTQDKISYGVEYMHKGGNGFRDSLGYRINDLDTKLKYQFNEDHSAQIHFQYYDEKSETPGGLLGTQFQSNPHLSNKPNDEFYGKRIEGDIRSHHQLTDDQQLDLLFYSYFFQRNWFLQNYVSNTTPNLALANSNGQYLRDFNVVGFEPKYTLNYDIGKTTDNLLTIGGRIYYDGVNRRSANGRTGTSREGDATLTAEEDLSSFVLAGYVENEFKITQQLSLVPGIRYEHIEQTREDVFAGTAEQFAEYDIWVPGIGIKYEFAPKTLAYFNVSESFRPPTFGDSFNPTIGASSLDLKASTAWTYEGGIRANPYSWLQADLGGFYTEYTDQVVVSGGVASNYNTESYGFEGSSQVGLLGLTEAIQNNNLNYSGDHEIFLQGGATLIESVFTDGAFQGNTLPYVPNETFTFGAMYDYRSRLNIGLQGRYVSHCFADNANTVTENSIGTIGQLDDYMVFDLKSQWKATDYLTVNAGVNNLFNEIYGTQRRTTQQKGIFPGPTRVFYISTTLTF